MTMVIFRSTRGEKLQMLRYKQYTAGPRKPVSIAQTEAEREAIVLLNKWETARVTPVQRYVGAIDTSSFN